MAGKQETPTMAEVIAKAIDAKLMTLRVALPAVIETYDPSQQRADISPLLRKKYLAGEEEVDLPVITNVPVQWPSANDGSSFLHLPLKAGDTGLAIFSDRSLDVWLSGSGKKVSPNDPRMHHISDAIFIPGIKTFSSALTNIPENNAVLQNGLMRIEIDPSGKISIEGESKEFLTIFDDLLDELINNARVVTAIGAQPFTAATVTRLTVIKDDLAEIKRI
jgi:hypothetical protein